MNVSPWLRAAAWLVAYLVLGVLHDWIGRSVLAHLQGRGPVSLFARRTVPLRATHALAALAALLAGAVIPLSGPLFPDEGAIGLGLFPDPESGLLVALAALWTAEALLSIPARRPPFRPALTQERAHGAVRCAAPVLLVASVLLIAHGAASQGAGASLRLSDLIGARTHWAELGWLALTQPVAAIVWIGCAPGAPPSAEPRRPLAWRWTALDRDLLAAALFFAGWRGPLVDRFPLLGVAYTGIKAGALAALHTWLAASAPAADYQGHARRVWLVYVPLAAMDLLLTVALVVLR
ncbi:MAG: NADH-quinone oxidoreductase subunit H [Anaerolineae bacterium]|nr:NADH-quinone oxidoreductase subunit H [Anaerolineae bacterium]